LEFREGLWRRKAVSKQNSLKLFCLQLALYCSRLHVLLLLDLLITIFKQAYVPLTKLETIFAVWKSKVIGYVTI